MKLKQKSFLLGITLYVAGLGTVMPALAQSPAVKVFAHRGGRHEFDENTISAFEASYKSGIRGYETDIRRTKDGHLVIFHDDNIKRMIGKEGSIEQLTLRELKALRTLKGHEILTLDELLSFLKDKPELYVEFEMKTNKPMYEPDVLAKYCDELYKKVSESKPRSSTYVFTSFDKRPLQYLKKNFPTVDLLFIKSEGLTQEVLDEAKEMGIKRLGCRVDQTTRNMVDNAKKQGFTVSLWPGSNVEDFLLGVTLGSDYLCTDVPVAVMEWVAKHPNWVKLK